MANQPPVAAQLFQFDLSARLYRSRWTFTRPLDNEHILLYAPDFRGMPIIVSPAVNAFLDCFAEGEPVGTSLSRFQGSEGKSLPQWLQIANELVDRGFLRDAPDGSTFVPRGYHSSHKAMNIWLHINNYCNLECSYCFVEHSKTHMSEDTAKATVARIGQTVRTYEVKDILVKFAGGEPTLALPQMEFFYERLTEELRDTGAYVHWTVLTNGTNLNDRFLRFIQKAKLTVSISIDGYGRYHDLYRVYRTPGRTKQRSELTVMEDNGHARGSWGVINRNIERLQQQGIRPYINAMVGPKTSRGLPELAKWIFGNGMIGTIHVVRNVGDSWECREERAAEYKAYCQQLAEDFELMFLEMEKPVYQLNLPRWMEVAELSFEDPAPDICCGIGSDHIVIGHNGMLASCPMTVHEAKVVPLNDLFAATKETFTASSIDRGGKDCLSCQWFKVCASGCPVANERIRGTAFTQSPLCEFWKYVIPRYTVFYGRKLLQARQPQTVAVWSGYAPRETTSLQPIP